MKKEVTSYKQIVRSTSLIGGAQLITLVIGLIQTKSVAIFLGPLGVGITGMYGSILALTAQISGLGIRTSGVKEIAKAAENQNHEKISCTVISLQRICWLTGLVGAISLWLLAAPLSRMAFGNEDHTLALKLLSCIILLRNIQGGQMALIQGLRRVGDLAKLEIIGSICGATVAVAWYFYLGLEGIVPALLSLAVLRLFFSWLYARKITVAKISVSWLTSLSKAKGLVELGIAFMLTALVAIIVNFFARWIINFQIDLIAVGIYQSAFRLSGVYSNFITSAMGTDYYPRLAAVADDHVMVNRLVNEQTEIGLLFAIPGLIATLVYAPLLIEVFYTVDFLPATELLKWFVLGAVIKVISVPMGYIIVAKGLAKKFVLVETSVSILHVLLIFYGLDLFGLKGVAIAYFALYICYLILMLMVTKSLTDFIWNRRVQRLFITFLPLIISVFVCLKLLNTHHALWIGSALFILSSGFCLYELTRRLGKEHRISRLVSRIPIFKMLVYKA